MTVFEDVFGHNLSLDDRHRRHIITQHPEIRPYLNRLAEVFRSPEWVKRSRYDMSVLLYYRFYEDIFDGKYLLAVGRIRPKPMVLTCYITDILKQGVLLWPKH